MSMLARRVMDLMGLGRMLRVYRTTPVPSPHSSRS